MFTKLFCKDTTERVISTAAQAAIGVLTADGVLGVGDVDFNAGASIVGLAALVSLLKALVAGKATANSSVSPASLAK